MDALIHTQARRTVALLWNDLPTGTDPDEFETSVCLHMATFLSVIAAEKPDAENLARRVIKRAQLIYDDEVWQRHHSLPDELFLRYLIELSLVNVMAYVPGLRQRIKKHHRLVATAAECLPRTIHPN